MKFVILIVGLLILFIQLNALGQKKPNPDDYLYNEIVTIKGKVTVFALREDSEPIIGSHQSLIFQRVDCKKCLISTRTDCNGNYEIYVSRGKYRLIVRNGTQIGAMTDILALSQPKIINAFEPTYNIFDIKLVLPFEPLHLELPEGDVLPCKDASNKSMDVRRNSLPHKNIHS